MSGDREKTAGEAAVAKVLRREGELDDAGARTPADQPPSPQSAQPTPDPGSEAARPSVLEPHSSNGADHAGSWVPKVAAGAIVAAAVALFLKSRGS